MGESTGFYPSSSFVPPSPQELAARLPNLEVIELLGHGGMGVVYKGRQPFLDRHVAIKVIRADVGNDEESQQRFVREARSLARLVHPYIVTVFDFGKSVDLCYLVMEYVEGSSLRQLLKEKSVAPRDVLDFVPQIGEALQFAHESGIVHRDVKPENILIDRRNRVRLVDFGLAKLLGSQAQSSPEDHRIVGTRGYMAPELLSMLESVDHRADIYSTGVVSFEMLTGEIPKGRPVPPSSKAATDQRLDPIVLRALEQDREKRYQQMQHMNTDLLLTTRTPESTIRIRRTIPASVERVFAAWTNPEQMVDWYAPSDDFTTPIAEVDLQVGGKFKVGMKRNGQEHTKIVTGQYCRVEVPYLIVFTWAWEAPRADTHETQVTLEFRPNGDATDLTLTHERFRDEELRKGHSEGWTGVLGRLSRKLSS
jgi:serine/threonine protein kinase